jgi:DNA-binding transcriptional LysR family regulator
MLDLRKLRYFLTVAEELHFGRAALRLHLAQPPLTRQISALEAELGFRLFDRTSRTVSLTPQGRSFLPYARAVLEQVDLAEVIAGKLAAGAGQTEVQALSLGEERLVAAVSSDSPLANQAEVSLAQLSGYPLILFPADYGSGLNQSIEQLYRHKCLPLRAGPSGRQITSIIALVAAGQGVALVPECTQSLMNKGVTYRPLVDLDAYAQLLVLTRAEGRSLMVEAFMKVIDELLYIR